tara:strand:- start:1628 stop:2407 length:780 start_codon:yes stop_codon:yes gene_type:complete
MVLHLKTIEQVQSEQIDEEIDIQFIWHKADEEDFEVAPKPKKMTQFFPNKMKGHELSVPPKEMPSECIGFNPSVKKCMPFTDCMKLGFGIPLWHYLFIRNGEAYDSAQNSINPNDDMPYNLGSHKKMQLENTTLNELKLPSTIRKLSSPWRITTPKGWSCLFTAPYHRDDIPVKIFGGVVDTDIYPVAPQLPFLVDPDFAGEVPMGTLIAQVIPFKRVNSKMKLSYKTEKEAKEIKQTYARFKAHSKNCYRDHYRSKER